MELSLIDFHIWKKISLTDMRIPLNRKQLKNAGHEIMMYKLAKNIKRNDISNIDYTTGATNGHQLKALSERLCDSILLYYLVPISDNTNKLEYLSKFLMEYTTKIKRLFAAHNNNVTKRNIKPTYSYKEDNNYKKYIKDA